MIVQQGITSFVSLLDNVMVGRLGTESMSGVAIVNQLLFVFNLTIFGGLAGASIFGAQFYGKGDHKGVRYALRFKLIFSVLMAVIAIVALLFFNNPLISLFFTDYNKIDLTILPLTALEDYLNGDGLREILLDKDGRVEEKPTPTDKEYHIQKPSARSFDDCCNEFWNITPYVVKGLCRRELLFAIDLLAMMRNELLRMLSWQVGSAYGFTFSVGKNYKFIDQYLPAEQWQALLSTYRTDSVENTWRSLFTCHELFRDAAKNFAAKYGYTYPDYDENVSRYVRDMYAEYEAK